MDNGDKAMKKTYLDNASTTFPKPESVAKAIYEYLTSSGANINRGCYSEAYDIEAKVFETRQMICDLFHGEDCKNVVFTKNITESLNILLKGFLKPGDHVLVSSMEHNAMMRPLNQLEEYGVSFSRIPCDEEGRLCVEDMGSLLRKETRLVVMLHASNVCGSLMPIKEVGEFCRKHSLKFFLDSAQTAGVWPINMEEMGIDAVAFTGHKGLLGPQGIGGFIIKEDLISQITPLLSGGTGSISHTEEIPEFMPDRFEAGTMNLPGILGLRESLLYIEETGIDKIREHELNLTGKFIKEVDKIQGIRIIGPKDMDKRSGVVSIQIEGQDQGVAADRLDQEYGIMVRVGLHCAPAAHKSLGTYPEGTIRFSFGVFNTEDDVDLAVQALREIVGGK